MQVTAERIQEFMPKVRLEVHATFDDPWLIARDHNGSVILHGWLRKNREANSVLVL